MTPPKDPLAGYRDKLARGEVTEIRWADDGNGPPVTEGQVIPLRHGGVEVDHVRRRMEGRDWVYVARFTLIRGDSSRRFFLGKGLGYVGDPGQASPAGESEFERPDSQGVSLYEVPAEPPEPECVPPHVVRELPSTVAARARFEESRQREADFRRATAAAKRLRALRHRAETSGVDLSPDIDEIEQILSRIEGRLEAA